MSAFADLMRQRSGGVLRTIISQMRSTKPSKSNNTDKENTDNVERTNKEVERQERQTITLQTYRQLRNNNNVNAAAAARSSATAALARLKAKRERVPRIELTEQIIQEYVQLERLIHGLERRNLLKKLETKVIFADELQKSAVHPQDATLKELKRQTERKRSKYEKIQDPFFRETLNSNWQQRFDAEKQEYEEALARERAAEEDLKVVKQQYERAAKIVDIFRRQCETLGNAYERQRQIFVGIFGADFASTRLDEVELELEATLDMQRRVLDTKFMWLNGRELLVHAQTQLAFGVSKWSELLEIEPSKTRTRYNAAAEAANIFSAAAQNIQSCRVYMGYIRFPHASEDDMTQLETATQNALNAIHVGTAQSNDAVRRRAFNVFRSTHQKVIALIQWFDRIINDDILKTLDRTNTNITKRRKQLRELRLELMRQRVRETALLNRDGLMDINYDDVSAPADEVEEEDEEELLRGHNLQEAIESQEQQQRRFSKVTNRLDVANIVADEEIDTERKRPTDNPLETTDNHLVTANGERVSLSSSTTTSSQRRQQILATPNRELLLREARHIIANYETTRMLLRQQDEMERRRQRAAIEERLRFHRRKVGGRFHNGDATLWVDGDEAAVDASGRFLPPLGGVTLLPMSTGTPRPPQSHRTSTTLPPIPPQVQHFSSTESGGESLLQHRRRPPRGQLASSMSIASSSYTTVSSSSPRNIVDCVDERRRTTEIRRSLKRHGSSRIDENDNEAEDETYEEETESDEVEE